MGKNDGSVNGVRYFQCLPNHGVMTPPKNISVIDDVPSAMPSPRVSRAVVNGMRAAVGDRKGVVRFVGETQFAPGEWVGIELDEPCEQISSLFFNIVLICPFCCPCQNKYLSMIFFIFYFFGIVGKNNGSVNGVRYFECHDLHGLFSISNKVTILPNRIDDPASSSLTAAAAAADSVSAAAPTQASTGSSTAATLAAPSPLSSSSSSATGAGTVTLDPQESENLMGKLEFAQEESEVLRQEMTEREQELASLRKQLSEAQAKLAEASSATSVAAAVAAAAAAAAASSSSAPISSSSDSAAVVAYEAQVKSLQDQLQAAHAQLKSSTNSLTQREADLAAAKAQASEQLDALKKQVANVVNVSNDPFFFFTKKSFFLQTKKKKKKAETPKINESFFPPPPNAGKSRRPSSAMQSWCSRWQH